MLTPDSIIAFIKAAEDAISDRIKKHDDYVLKRQEAIQAALKKTAQPEIQQTALNHLRVRSDEAISFTNVATVPTFPPELQSTITMDSYISDMLNALFEDHTVSQSGCKIEKARDLKEPLLTHDFSVFGASNLQKLSKVEAFIDVTHQVGQPGQIDISSTVPNTKSHCINPTLEDFLKYFNDNYNQLQTLLSDINGKASNMTIFFGIVENFSIPDRYIDFKVQVQDETEPRELSSLEAQRLAPLVTALTAGCIEAMNKTKPTVWAYTHPANKNLLFASLENAQSKLIVESNKEELLEAKDLTSIKGKALTHEEQETLRQKQQNKPPIISSFIKQIADGNFDELKAHLKKLNTLCFEYNQNELGIMATTDELNAKGEDLLLKEKKALEDNRDKLGAQKQTFKALILADYASLITPLMGAEFADAISEYLKKNHGKNAPTKDTPLLLTLASFISDVINSKLNEPSQAEQLANLLRIGTGVVLYETDDEELFYSRVNNPLSGDLRRFNQLQKIANNAKNATDPNDKEKSTAEKDKSTKQLINIVIGTLNTSLTQILASHDSGGDSPNENDLRDLQNTLNTYKDYVNQLSAPIVTTSFAPECAEIYLNLVQCDLDQAHANEFLAFIKQFSPEFGVSNSDFNGAFLKSLGEIRFDNTQKDEYKNEIKDKIKKFSESFRYRFNSVVKSIPNPFASTRSTWPKRSYRDRFSDYMNSLKNGAKSLGESVIIGAGFVGARIIAAVSSIGNAFASGWQSFSSLFNKSKEASASPSSSPKLSSPSAPDQPSILNRAIMRVVYTFHVVGDTLKHVKEYLAPRKKKNETSGTSSVIYDPSRDSLNSETEALFAPELAELAALDPQEQPADEPQTQPKSTLSLAQRIQANIWGVFASISTAPTSSSSASTALKIAAASAAPAAPATESTDATTQPIANLLILIRNRDINKKTLTGDTTNTKLKHAVATFEQNNNNPNAADRLILQRAKTAIRINEISSEDPWKNHKKSIKILRKAYLQLCDIIDTLDASKQEVVDVNAPINTLGRQAPFNYDIVRTALDSAMKQLETIVGPNALSSIQDILKDTFTATDVQRFNANPILQAYTVWRANPTEEKNKTTYRTALKEYKYELPEEGSFDLPADFSQTLSTVDLKILAQYRTFWITRENFKALEEKVNQMDSSELGPRKKEIEDAAFSDEGATTLEQTELALITNRLARIDAERLEKKQAAKHAQGDPASSRTGELTLYQQNLAQTQASAKEPTQMRRKN